MKASAAAAAVGRRPAAPASKASKAVAKAVTKPPKKTAQIQAVPAKPRPTAIRHPDPEAAKPAAVKQPPMKAAVAKPAGVKTTATKPATTKPAVKPALVHSAEAAKPRPPVADVRGEAAQPKLRQVTPQHPEPVPAAPSADPVPPAEIPAAASSPETPKSPMIPAHEAAAPKPAAAPIVKKNEPMKEPAPLSTPPVSTPSAAAEPQPVMPMPPRAPMSMNRPMPMPRPMAKAEVFTEGDHVVYPTHGVGKVERIAVEEIAGHKLELIHITFEENRMTLRVPVSKARTAGLRKLATRKLLDEALAVLKGRARIKRTMWSRRAQEYEAKINSGDPLSIAEVVRDLHRNAGQPDQSFSERQIYESAMDRLAAELAALDQTDKMTAATKLTEFLKTV